MNGSVVARDFANNSDREEFARAAVAGLSVSPRAIPAKFLYDARGSALFDVICELPEYYVTRTETQILRRVAPEIAKLAGPNCALVEFGSGSSVKSRLLLDAMPDLAVYAPIDISRVHLDATAERLRGDYPGLAISPICADYMALESLPELGRTVDRRLGFFPGSTIGNLEPADAKTFLKRARQMLGRDGALVVGVDLKKDPAILHAAYNDSAGVTAAFTLNLLRRMNRELDATFDLAAFEHDASYNAEQGRIEIYFRSVRPQTVTVAGYRFFLAGGERVLAEYSYKYAPADFPDLIEGTGFTLAETWSDERNFFAVLYLTAC
jgi:dimethylhistidine N-methyltransferase